MSAQTSAETTAGRVVLVGAGPGDPDLVTVKGLKALRMADVVLYDRLAPSELLDEAPEGCRLIPVGKSPLRRSTSQDQINRLMIDEARGGAAVVRLKGGDPFVFGRGGEEVRVLVEAGIQVEVVPGISSALAAPAMAHVPVTHRHVAASFAVVTGNRASPEAPEPDWAALASVDTVVVLMAVAQLEHVAESLLRAGKAATTPVAVIENATRPQERHLSTRLGDLGTAARSAGIRAPAVLVIGQTARGALDLPIANSCLEPRDADQASSRSSCCV